MKKGFTLVELAIVLVVIGIIAGLAIKGLTMIDSARLSNELGKINKLSTAFALYFEKNGKRPPKDIDNSTNYSIVYSIRSLYDFGITDGTIKPNLDYSKGMPTSKIQLSACAIAKSQGDKHYLYDEEGLDNSTNVHILPSDNVCVIFTGYSHFFYCSAEVIYDDGNVFGGYGMALNKGGASADTGLDTESSWRIDPVSGQPDLNADYECRKAKSNAYGERWGYLVF